MNPTLTTGELTSEHIYRDIVITTDDWSIRGLLRRVEHGADEISDQSVCEAYERVTPGGKWVGLVVGPFDFRANGTETITFV